jgi:hypothetical protein
VAIANLAEFMTAKIDIAEELKEIGRASRVGVYGSEEFKRAFVATKRSEMPDEDKGVTIDILITLVCARLKCTTGQLISKDKQRNVVDARAVLARAAQLQKGLTLSDVSRALNKHQGTISRLASRAAKNARLQKIVDELVKTEIAESQSPAWGGTNYLKTHSNLVNYSRSFFSYLFF